VSAVLDFTSALYLGLEHPGSSLGSWSQLTTGVPAALSPTPEASMAARELAALQGCGAETLGASTLHLFWNLLGMVPRDSVVMNVDAGT
jgi:8-amino-7-oxononanoate synthase